MTHDELLAKINERTDYAVEIMQERTGAYEPDDYAWFALRAVVELHKPITPNILYCSECRPRYNGDPEIVLYPCPTIRAIEKELGL